MDYPDVPAGRATSTLYTYDAAYNRTGEITVDAGSATLNDLTYGYNSRQQLTTVTNNLDASQHVSYTFDANPCEYRQVKGYTQCNPSGG